MMRYPERRISQAPKEWLIKADTTRGEKIAGITLHSSRSGVSDGDDGPRTERWMWNVLNQARDKTTGNTTGTLLNWGSSCDLIIFEDGTRVWVTDPDVEWPSYGAGYGGAGSNTWNASLYYIQVELAQGINADPFTGAQIDSLAEWIAIATKRYGFPIERIPYLTQTGPIPRGINDHENTANGRKLGKSDPGYRFPWPEFLARALTEEAMMNTPPGLYREEGTAPVYIWDGRILHHVGSPEMMVALFGPEGWSKVTELPGDHSLWQSLAIGVLGEIE